jgi:mono/diheme cytochrome c family protein
MAKGFFFGILVTVLAGIGIAYGVLVTGLIPVSTNATPGRLETIAARTDLRAVLRRQAPKGANPVALTDANLVAGINLFGTHCAACHGTAGGNAAPTPIAKGEYPKPPQLASDGVEGDPAGWTFWKIKHGIRWTGMPGWKYELNDRQIWTLALFLKHMNKLPPSAEAAWQAVGRPPAATLSRQQQNMVDPPAK